MFFHYFCKNENENIIYIKIYIAGPYRADWTGYSSFVYPAGTELPDKKGRTMGGRK